MRTDLSPAELDDLIREALGEARAAVRGRLRARFEAELEAQVEARLTTPPEKEKEKEEEQTPEAGDGLWLYGVTAQGEAPALPGVAEGHAPRTVGAAGLVALVSTVPLGEFGEAGLKRNLNDMRWLERVARAHEQVLEAALPEAPIVPMRLCTIYRTEDQLRAQLEDRRQELTDTLAQLDGRGEWGVKATADRDHLATRLRERAEHRPVGVGGAYLGRKQQERKLRDEVDATLEAAVRDSHARLEEWAAATKLLPSQRAELSGHTGEMVLNGAYLVDDERLEGFRQVVDGLARQYTDLAFELTGPWPPFNFSGDA